MICLVDRNDTASSSNGRHPQVACCRDSTGQRSPEIARIFNSTISSSRLTNITNFCVSMAMNTVLFRNALGSSMCWLSSLQPMEPATQTTNARDNPCLFNNADHFHQPKSQCPESSQPIFSGLNVPVLCRTVPVKNQTTAKQKARGSIEEHARADPPDR